MVETTKVRKAREEDLEEILQIQESRNIEQTSTDARSREGFLVYLMDNETLRTYQSQKNYFLYVYEDKGIVAYIAACDSTQLEQRVFQNATLYDDANRKLLQQRFLYGKHVAKKKGVGRDIVEELENKLFDEARTQGYESFIVEIALAPFNERSLLFHQNNGYVLIGEYYDSIKDITWGIVYKDLKIPEVKT